MAERPKKRTSEATTNGYVKIPKLRLKYKPCSLTENTIHVSVGNYPIYKYSRRYAKRFSRLSQKVKSHFSTRKTIFDEEDTTCVNLTFLKNRLSSLDVENSVVSSLTKKPTQSVTASCSRPFEILVSSSNIKNFVFSYLTKGKQNGNDAYVLLIDESKTDYLYTPGSDTCDGIDIRICTVGQGKIHEGICGLLERHVFQEIKADAAMLLQEARQIAKRKLHSEENKRLIAVKEVLSQIKSAYARSSVPAWEHPTFEKTQMQLDDSVARDLANIEGVMTYGYIFDILNVFVNDSIGQRQARKINRDIQRLGVKDFIVRSFERGFEPLSYKVGSTIRNKIGQGTLGGFADRTDQDGDVSLCAITAEHCVQPNIHASNRELDVFVHVQDNQQKIGRTLVPRKQTLDITAIEITDEPERFDTLFKTLDGQPSTSCQLVENVYSNREQASGRLVFIFGEQLAPGKGVIVSNDSLRSIVPTKDLDSYVLIQEDEGIFARKGNSGAIVCEEDMSGQLNVISMVEGRLMTPGSTSRIDDRTIYRTINLKAGLDQLCDQYQSTFRLRGQQ